MAFLGNVGNSGNTNSDFLCQYFAIELTKKERFCGHKEEDKRLKKFAKSRKLINEYASVSRLVKILKI